MTWSTVAKASVVPLTALPLSACVSQSSYDTLQAQNQQLQAQNRPLDPLYPVIFFDALRFKIHDEGLVRNKAFDVALALNSDGEKEVLGLWIEPTEGAKFCPRA